MPARRKPTSQTRAFSQPAPPPATPPAAAAETPLPAAPPKVEPFTFPRATITRGEDISFEIELTHGDITEVSSRVILLGQVQGLNPSSATASIDAVMEGNLLRLLSLHGSARGAGGLDIIPTGRHPIMAELIAFLSLGRWESFQWEVLTAAANSALRALLASHFDEVATTLMGARFDGNEKLNVKLALRHQLLGFIQALGDMPESGRFRRLVLVESNRERISEIYEVLKDLVHGSDFEGVRTTLIASNLPQRIRHTAREGGPALPQLYRSNILNLSVKLEKGATVDQMKTALLAQMQPAEGSGATVKLVKGNEFGGMVERLYSQSQVDLEQGLKKVEALTKIADVVSAILPPSVLAELEKQKQPRIEIIHDAETSRVPWETMRFADGRSPALLGGISRRFVSESVRTLWALEPAARLRVLLVIDPLNDLPGAQTEGQAMLDFLQVHPLVNVKLLWDKNHGITERTLKDTLLAETFDVLHYAGHSVFHRDNRQFSGLQLMGGEVFTGDDAQKLARFPSVVLLNSCQSARIRRLDSVVTSNNSRKELQDKIRHRDLSERAVSLAEAFLLAGVHHFIGTFWPVQDEAAVDFAKSLYGALAGGRKMGEAITGARRVLYEKKMPDWANYIHYGDPDAVLFR